MLDVKALRDNYQAITTRLSTRGGNLSALDHFLDIDEKHRKLIQETEALKARRNDVSQEIAQKKKNKENADAIIKEMREVGDKIKELDESLRNIEGELETMLLSVPNLPHESVPVGQDEDENVEIRRIGEQPTFAFEPKPHWEIGTTLDILDFERAAKVTGSRFVFYKGLGARLERALINFMMDLHADQHGYQEILPPYLVNRTSMTGTGQLPKFEEDAFKIREEDYFLSPTAEVSVTNYHSQEILNDSDLPMAYCAYSTNFRSEAGSAGRDTRGLIRQHQFNKVELVHFVKPENSYDTLELLTTHAENVLKQLGLSYRVITLCTGDLGFTAAKTYDLEVWLPSYDTFREISSCSNCEDYQARRAGIRFRRNSSSKKRPEFVHTLNGSGLAVGRTMAAILENYQQADGSVLIPEVLKPYMGGVEKIEAK